MEDGLFGKELPKQNRAFNTDDLVELQKSLERVYTHGDFRFEINLLEQVPIIIARGKGMTIRFELNADTGEITYQSHLDALEGSDGTLTDSSPLILDTDDLIRDAKRQIETVIEETVDPRLIDDE